MSEVGDRAEAPAGVVEDINSAMELVHESQELGTLFGGSLQAYDDSEVDAIFEKVKHWPAMVKVAGRLDSSRAILASSESIGYFLGSIFDLCLEKFRRSTDSSGLLIDCLSAVANISAGTDNRLVGIVMLAKTDVWRRLFQFCLPRKIELTGASSWILDLDEKSQTVYNVVCLNLGLRFSHLSEQSEDVNAESKMDELMETLISSHVLLVAVSLTCLGKTSQIREDGSSALEALCSNESLFSRAFFGQENLAETEELTIRTAEIGYIIGDCFRRYDVSEETGSCPRGLALKLLDSCQRYVHNASTPENNLQYKFLCALNDNGILSTLICPMMEIKSRLVIDSDCGRTMARSILSLASILDASVQGIRDKPICTKSAVLFLDLGIADFCLNQAKILRDALETKDIDKECEMNVLFSDSVSNVFDLLLRLIRGLNVSMDTNSDYFMGIVNVGVPLLGLAVKLINKFISNYDIPPEEGSSESSALLVLISKPVCLVQQWQLILAVCSSSEHGCLAMRGTDLAQICLQILDTPVGFSSTDQCISMTILSNLSLDAKHHLDFLNSFPDPKLLGRTLSQRMISLSDARGSGYAVAILRRFAETRNEAVYEKLFDSTAVNTLVNVDRFKLVDMANVERCRTLAHIVYTIFKNKIESERIVIENLPVAVADICFLLLSNITAMHMEALEALNLCSLSMFSIAINREMLVLSSNNSDEPKLVPITLLQVVENLSKSQKSASPVSGMAKKLYDELSKQDF